MSESKKYVDFIDGEFEPEAKIGVFNVAVAVLIVNDDNKILITQRSNTNPASPGSWELVHGRLNQSEGFEQAVEREVREEVGVRVEPLEILGTSLFMRTKEEPQHLSISYYAKLLPGETVEDTTEIADFAWVDYDEASERCADYVTPFLRQARILGLV